MQRIGSKSVFKELEGIEYFDFEEDFIEENVRCIPMIVRFKMDLVGVKLKLGEWSRFKPNERVELALKPTSTIYERTEYQFYLCKLINQYTKNKPSIIDIDSNPAWTDVTGLPSLLQEKLKEFDVELSLDLWSKLTELQRFALLKLCRSGHENKNFPKAMKEFGLM